MIEFKGVIFGDAEKRFKIKARVFFQIIWTITILLFLPSVIYFAVKTYNALVAVFYIAIFVIIFMITFVPASKKERASILPNKIIVDDDLIISISEKYTESRHIDDVKVVKDWGEFYELVFPFGKISNRFICQKSLLSKGTLEEFEALFEGIIIKM